MVDENLHANELAASPTTTRQVVTASLSEVHVPVNTEVSVLTESTELEDLSPNRIRQWTIRPGQLDDADEHPASIEEEDTATPCLGLSNDSNELAEPLLEETADRRPVGRSRWCLFQQLGRPSGVPKEWLWPLALGTLAVVIVAIAAVLAIYVEKRHLPAPSPAPDGPTRLPTLLRCASIISHHEITEKKSPLRWNILQNYFVNGGGQYIDLVDCDHPKSLFATVYSLMVIRESTNVHHPTWNSDRTYVTSMDDVCRWKRVTCDFVGEDYGVTELSFNNAKLSGTIPPELHGLWSLQNLHGYSNPGLQGLVPSEVGLLTHLVYLGLHKTNVEHELPSQLGQLTSLQRLLLHETKLTGRMPRQVCELRTNGTLLDLYANCHGQAFTMDCDCCTKCR